MGISNLVFQLLGALTYSFANAVSRVPAVQWLGLGKGFISILCIACYIFSWK